LFQASLKRLALKTLSFDPGDCKPGSIMVRIVRQADLDVFRFLSSIQSEERTKLSNNTNSRPSGPDSLSGGLTLFSLKLVRWLRRAPVQAGLFAVFMGSPAMATTIVPWSLDETIRQTDAIVLGTVISSETRWGDASHRWIETDYTFSVEEIIQGDPAIGAGNGSLVLTFWGGTLDGETQGIAGLRHPAMNERLILMLRPGWTEGGFTPVAGLNQGLFEVAATAEAGPEVVLDHEGQKLVLTITGQVVRDNTIGVQPAASSSVGLAVFIEWIRDNIAVIRSQASEAPGPVNSTDPRVLQTFSATPEATSSLESPATIAEPVPAAAPQASPASSIASPAPSRVERPSRGEVAAIEGPQKFSSQHQARLPIVVNQFIPSFAPWSPEDQYLMSRWNYYANEVFRVLTSPTGSFWLAQRPL